jgi:Gpi18-like mannosyltransferase
MSRTAAATASSEPRPPIVPWNVVAAAIVALAVYLHSLCWWTEPRDMTLFQGPWFAHIVSYGPVGAFAHPFSNYTPVYLYLMAFASLFHELWTPMSLIKTLSVAGTAFAALGVADLIRTLGGKPRYALLLFVMPPAVLNAALLAQCDALWSGACVFAVAAMIRGQSARSLMWCGLAIALKAQSVFIAPFIIGALIGRRTPLWQWTIPPLTYAALMLPAWFAGWPAYDLAMVYPNQPGWIPYPGDLANPWIFFSAWARETGKQLYWVGFVGVAVSVIAVGALTAKSVNKPRAMIFLALLSAIALPYFFPKMLERYFFLADLLSLSVALALRTRASILVAVAMQVASTFSLLTYMYFFGSPYLTMVGVLFSTGAMGTAFVQARHNGAEWPRLPEMLTSRPGYLPRPSAG